MNKYYFTISCICIFLFCLVVCSLGTIFYTNDNDDNSIKISASLSNR